MFFSYIILVSKLANVFIIVLRVEISVYEVYDSDGSDKLSRTNKH